MSCVMPTLSVTFLLLVFGWGRRVRSVLDESVSPRARFISPFRHRPLENKSKLLRPGEFASLLLALHPSVGYSRVARTGLFAAPQRINVAKTNRLRYKAPVMRKHRFQFLRRGIIPLCARFLGSLTGTTIDVDVEPSVGAPFASFGFGRFKTFALNGNANKAKWAFCPMQTVSLSGANLCLGWKFPALLLAPLWLFFSRSPVLLFLLLLCWLRTPNTGTGVLTWDSYITSQDLNTGAWRAFLGTVLNEIARNSLPGVLATDGDPSIKLPQSTCTGVSIEDGKLVLKGRLGEFQTRSLPGRSDTLGEPILVESLNFTLRMGCRSAQTGDSEFSYLTPRQSVMRSVLMWENPELKVSFGDGLPKFIARFLPQVWVPVLSTTGIALPRGMELHRASISDAGDGIILSGVVDLSRKDRGGDTSSAITVY